MIVILLAVGGIVGAIWWGVSASLDERSSGSGGGVVPGPAAPFIVTAPTGGVPIPGGGTGGMDAARLGTCLTESNAVRVAKKAAEVSDDSPRDFLGTPDGEYFSVGEDGTVTTVKPLPRGCPIP